MVEYVSAGCRWWNGESMTLCLFLSRVGSPLASFLAFCDRVEKRVGDAVTCRVEAIDDAWFARTVARPVVGRVCDFIVAPGKVAEGATIIVASTVVSAALVAWMIPFIHIWIATHSGAATSMEIAALVACEIAWLVPFFAALRVAGSADLGLMRGADEWRLRYRMAQTAVWSRRHPGESYWHHDWVYTRD